MLWVEALDFDTRGILEHFVFPRDFLAVVDFLERSGAVVEDVALGRQIPVFVDGGSLPILRIVKIKSRLFRQREVPPAVHQIPAIVLIGLDLRQQGVLFQIAGITQID